jgi:CarD family transcriptional regulator
LATKKPAATKKTPAKKAPARKPAAAKTTTAVKKAATAKKTPVKKPAAKKGPAKKAATAKKAPVKKPAAKKAPAKKAATAKKAPVKKPAAKKPAASKKTVAKKTPSKKSTTTRPSAKQAAPSTPAAKKSTAKADPFKVGDKVVYPHHGAATIVRKEKHEFKGEKQNFYVLEIATDQLIVRVPAASSIERGVRPVISKSKARQVFQTLRSEPQEAGSNWSRWYKVLTEKINSGDIFQVAEVIRDLDYAQKIKGISPALKRMLAKARLIIISELQFSLAVSEEEATKRLERALPKIEADEDA